MLSIAVDKPGGLITIVECETHICSHCRIHIEPEFNLEFCVGCEHLGPTRDSKIRMIGGIDFKSVAIHGYGPRCHPDSMDGRRAIEIDREISGRDESHVWGDSDSLC